MWEYSDKVKEHFLNPRNVGEVEGADGVGEVGSMACGDALKLTFKVGDDGRIVDAKFKTFGCASAIASASALTELLVGKTVEEAERLTNDHIAEYLGGLPKEKMHCSVMGQEALEKAIACYRGEPDKQPEGNVVCECFGVTDRQIERALSDNALTTIEEITNYIKAGGGCGKCHDTIQEIIDRVNGGGAEAPAKPKVLTNIQKIRLIEETLEREIKPALNQDGGDIQLVDVDGNRVMVKLTGRCASCAMSEVTLKDYVETKLKELVAPELVVEEVTS
ncbi:Fe-S cluster assembly protein NifU [Desulfatitalea alkaliphila]|uniref:Nitrogen fixation protein NifU n=1 Tax=Desulfatitalea alkaliphila TaxID=2929485 RepID=A0AA41UL93_9BACT|nr:Fe-S cluster assembly protein NifU [Desulfatitalea alkaliphila]MCJ8503159.1 Fe-S cluster assembly protein NifU [Desulfatitalea alkaliphila]